MQKAVVLMPENVADFIPALAVATCKSSDPELELTLVVQERLFELCSQISNLRAVSFHRDSKDDLESLITTLNSENFYKLYNCSNSHLAMWLSKQLNVAVKRKVNKLLAARGSFTYEDLNETRERKTVMSSNYTQFLEIPLAGVNHLDTTFSRIKKRIKRIIKPPVNTAQHISRVYADTLEVYDFNPLQWVYKRVACDSEYEGMIVLCPGGDSSAGRKWPYFRDIVRLLSSLDFVILGTEKDIGIAKAIAPHFPHRVRNLAGKITLDKAVSIMAGAAVVVANDSGFLQLSGYLGVPSIGLFGSSSPDRMRPLGTSSVVVYTSEKCSPCEKESCNKMNNSCMAKIKADYIVEMIRTCCHRQASNMEALPVEPFF